MEFTNEIEIRRPPGEVFAYLARFENVPQWNHSVVETRKASAGPVGVGSVYIQRRLIPRPVDNPIRIVEFDPPARVVITGDIRALRGQSTYRLEPVPGGTRLINRVGLEPRGLARVVAPLAGGLIRRAIAADLVQLKVLLETG